MFYQEILKSFGLILNKDYMNEKSNSQKIVEAENTNSFVLTGVIVAFFLLLIGILLYVYATNNSVNNMNDSTSTVTDTSNQEDNNNSNNDDQDIVSLPVSYLNFEIQ